MTTAHKIQEFLDARPQYYLQPERFRSARRAVLACDRTEVMACFEARLQDLDDEVRAQAVEGLALLYRTDATDTLLRWLDDESVIVRWVVCGCLHDIGDQRAQPGLLNRLKVDLDPQVRGVAADALGRVGGVEVLPDLYRTWQHDHEEDQQGHSPSSYAAAGIIDLLQRWVVRQLHNTAARDFSEATPHGQLQGRVTAEAIPCDDEHGRITKSPRYAHLPISAFGNGLSTQLDLQTNLVTPFEIAVTYTDRACKISRAFVFQHLPSDDTNWAIDTIVDPAALYGAG